LPGRIDRPDGGGDSRERGARAGATEPAKGEEERPSRSPLLSFQPDPVLAGPVVKAGLRQNSI